MYQRGTFGGILPNGDLVALRGTSACETQGHCSLKRQRAMKVSEMFRVAFSHPRLPKDVEERHEASERSIVAARANGNLRIQSGAFDIREELDRTYERIQRGEFRDR